MFPNNSVAITPLTQIPDSHEQLYGPAQPSSLMGRRHCVKESRTRTTDSEALANSWFERHRFNPPVGVLHDPNGTGVKSVGEPASLVYPWKEIFGMSGWMFFFGTLLVITQRRLQYLKTLPENMTRPHLPSDNRQKAMI